MWWTVTSSEARSSKREEQNIRLITTISKWAETNGAVGVYEVFRRTHHYKKREKKDGS